MYIPANIELVRAIIEKNPNATFDEITADSSINRFTLGEIIHLALRLSKLTSGWVPHDLTDANRRERVAACRETLAKFEEGK